MLRYHRRWNTELAAISRKRSWMQSCTPGHPARDSRLWWFRRV